MTLHLENVGIGIGDANLIAPFTLSVASGEIVTLMGPSGSGKSSLLAFIAGDLIAPLKGSGKVELNGVDMGTLRPELRRVGRLFQDDLLFPHLTVGENLLFGLPRGDRATRNEAMLSALHQADLAGFENREPQTLSGGQRARVSLMRALLAKPDCMLLDESFNKLDKDLRAAMRDYVFSHLKARKVPSLLVTHDIEDVPIGGAIYRIDKAGELRNV
jgi:putative thiamine transport system ATP-binding protein